MTSKHRITVGEELRYDGDVQGLRGLSGTYARSPVAAQGGLLGWVFPENYGTITYGKGLTQAQATANAAAIQAAINAVNNGGGIAANTAGGGTVWIGGLIEVYTPSASAALTIYSGVHLRGVGPAGDVFSGTDSRLPYRGSVLRLWSGANQDLIQTANFAALTGTTSPSAFATPNRFGIYDLVLDGNKAGNASGNCLTIFGRSSWLQNLVVQNAAGEGIYSEYGTSAGYDNEAQWLNLRVQDNVGHGIDFNGPHDSVMANIFSARNGGSGIVVSTRSGSLLVTNMHNWGNGLYNFDVGASDISFLNCVCDSAGGIGKAGIRLLKGGVRWIGGSIYGTGMAGEVLVQLGDGSTATTIGGCDFDTRWWNIALGSVPLAYTTGVSLLANRWRGSIANNTNSRTAVGTAVAVVSGAQTFPLATLNVASTTGFPTSGSVYTPVGTFSYTGTTATSFTGVTGGSAGTLADGTVVRQGNLLSTTNETYDWRSEDGGTIGVFQDGAVSTSKRIENRITDFVGAVIIRNVATVTSTLAANGAVTIDAAACTSYVLTLQANCTGMTINNPTGNEEITITVIQDATGGRTYAYPANAKFAGGAAPADTTASKRTSVRFRYDAGSSAWWETARAVAVG